ncbi:bis(5'-nucleosyl)-tetraphosphatase (symmetrical) YqeK [Atopobacter phocae]|uniref:bis(5'-nucleosyl)-tetraphosphatase (symmetrical) YqeK n=1 Tax=Atopobacter phocae TaxID=136492 RepID=UPI0004B30ADD|nr:bis(5'-nucleosyl)-tetraphosphatase (symmetrical) YqeK [Atopobacter phocae]
MENNNNDVITTSIVYTGKWINLTRNQLIEELSDNLTEKRLQHCLRVEETAVQLARHYGEDVEAASIVGLSHDLLRELSDGEMAIWIQSYGLNKDLIPYGRELMHGPLAAEWLKRHAQLTDSSIYQAIFVHTMGAQEMSQLSQILFLADYIEPARSFPGVEIARELAYQNLDQATAFKLQHSLMYLIQSGHAVYPKTIEAYNAWIKHSANQKLEE